MAFEALVEGVGHERQAPTSRLRSWRYQILVLISIVAAAVLAALAKTVPYFPFDLEVTLAIQSLSIPGMETFFRAVAWVGFPPQSNFIWGAVILGLFLIGLRLEAAMLAFAAAGSAGLWFAIVPLIDRPRPSPDLVHVAMQLPTGSFPSGHVLNLTAIFGFLIFLVIVTISNAVLRRVLAVALAVPIVTIGLARVYDGAHWPSDVLGGYVIGGIWLALTIGLYQTLSRRFRIGDRCTPMRA
jgi:membrane-associated phospholipid phosphatase